MFKQIGYFVFFTILVHVCVLGLHTPAVAGEPRASRHAERVRRDIARLGIGTETRVTIDLTSGRRVLGSIKSIGDGDFVVHLQDSNETQVVPYGDVAKVQGQNLRSGVKIAIIVSAVVAVIVLFASFNDT